MRYSELEIMRKKGNEEEKEKKRTREIENERDGRIHTQREIKQAKEGPRTNERKEENEEEN